MDYVHQQTEVSGDDQILISNHFIHERMSGRDSSANMGRVSQRDNVQF